MGSSWGPPCSGQPSEVQPYVINSDGTLTAGTLDILPLYATQGYAMTGSPDGSLLFLMTRANTEGGIIYSSGIDQSTGNVSFVLAYSYSFLGETPVLSTGGLAVDSTSTYLYSSAGTFLIQDGAISLLTSITSPYTGGASLLASPSLPFIFAQTADTGLGPSQFLSDEVNSDGSLTPAPGSPYTFDGFNVALSGAAPVPTKAVMWIQPDTPINITGVAVGQTGNAGAMISNEGYGPLMIIHVTVTGDPSLTAATDCAVPVGPLGSCSAGVVFTPTSVGTFTGTLTIESNVGARTFAISATSVAPPQPMPDPILHSPSPILFPDTALGSSSPLTFQLQNGATATEPMTVSSITIGGSNPSDYSATSNCTAAPIAVGASCSITITFAPQALGGRAAGININGPSTVLTGATLTGTGVTTVTKYTFSSSAVGPGTVTQSPAGTSFANNTTITLAETPNANATFVNWSGVTCAASTATTCSAVLNANTVATANFAANVTLTTTVVGPGTITQSPTGTTFAAGSQVVLTAVPNTGATFVSWAPSSACFPSTPATECLVTLNANTTVTATFSSPQFSLTTSVVGPGSIQQAPTGTSFASGTPITLTAVPNTGATFTSWSGGACAGSTNAMCAFNISANTSVTATFAAAQYTLATTVSGPGTITQSPTGTSFASGTAIALTAVPNTGATFTSWSGGACSGSTSTACAFNISANTSVTATFASGPVVTTPAPSQTGAAGGSFTFPLSASGFSAPPTYTASCAIPAGSCTITGTTLVVTTTARTAALVHQMAAWVSPAGRAGAGRYWDNAGSAPTSVFLAGVAEMLLAMLAGMMLVSISRGRDASEHGARAAVRWRRTAPALATLVAFVGLALLVACGGSGGGGGTTPTGTPAGTYMVAVTATAGTQTATTNVSVIVQ